jgi:hypothetical protein
MHCKFISMNKYSLLLSNNLNECRLLCNSGNTTQFNLEQFKARHDMSPKLSVCADVTANSHLRNSIKSVPAQPAAYFIMKSRQLLRWRSRYTNLVVSLIFLPICWVWVNFPSSFLKIFYHQNGKQKIHKEYFSFIITQTSIKLSVKKDALLFSNWMFVSHNFYYKSN